MSKTPYYNKTENAIEAGQSTGMKIEDVLKTYLVKPNNILAILRIFRKKPTSEIASALSITEDQLKHYETTDELIPFQLVPKIAKIFNVELKLLLQFLGHAIPSQPQQEQDELEEFALAAQYSGPDLTKQEKIDLNDLFKMIVENSKK